MSDLYPVRDAYAVLNPILDGWAEQNGIQWQREYKGYSVRSFSWPLADSESVQLWLDEPTNGQLTIHVCQNTKRGGQHSRSWTVPIGDLEPTLEDSFEAASSLLAKLKAN